MSHVPERDWSWRHWWRGRREVGLCYLYLREPGAEDTGGGGGVRLGCHMYLRKPGAGDTGGRGGLRLGCTVRPCTPDPTLGPDLTRVLAVLQVVPGKVPHKIEGFLSQVLDVRACLFSNN